MTQTNLVYIHEVDNTTNKMKIGSLDTVGKTEWVTITDEALSDARLALKFSKEDNQPAIVLFDNVKKCIVHDRDC